MDFKDFKKVGSTSTHTTFQHPSGHTIQVAHNSLTPEQRKQLKEIPAQTATERLREQRQLKKMKDGGKVVGRQATEEEIQTGVYGGLPLSQEESPYAFATPYQPQPQAAVPIEEPSREKQVIENVTKLLSEPKPEPMYEKMASRPEPKMGNLDLNKYIAPQQAQPTAMDIGKTPQEKEIEATSRIAGETKAIQAKEAEDTAAAYRNAMKASIDADSLMKKEEEDLKYNIDRINKEIISKKIDPNRYMANMSTFGKVATALGLILGGIGQGMTGGKENLALRMLEKSIDNDLDAQKEELGKKNNLLTAYYKMYGDIQQARAAAKATALQVVQMQAHAISEQSRSQQALKQNELLQAQLETKKQQEISRKAQVVMDQNLSQALKDQTAVPSSDQVYDYIYRNVPEKQQKETIQAYNDYSKAVEQIEVLKQMMKDQQELNSIANLTNFVQRQQKLQAYRVGLINTIKDITNETRMSDQEFKNFVDPFVTKFYKSAETAQKQADILIETNLIPKIKGTLPRLRGAKLYFSPPVSGTPIQGLKKPGE